MPACPWGWERDLASVPDQPAAPKKDRQLKARCFLWSRPPRVRVNHKRLRRLLQAWDLALPRKVARPNPCGVRRILGTGRGKLDLVLGRWTGLVAVLSTYFTEIRYAGGTRKAHLMAILDVESGWVPGWAVGSSADRGLALQGWEEVKKALERVGRGTEALIVHQTKTPCKRASAGCRRT